MRLFLIFLLLTSCRANKTVVSVPVPPQQVHMDQHELPFTASDGDTQYENGLYSVLQNANGPLELYHTKVTNYVMTDQKLATDGSELGGVNVGGKAWIHQSTIHDGSYFHDSVRFTQSQAFANLTICGDLYACESFFKGDVNVEGELTAECSDFQGLLTAKAEMVDLQSSHVADLVVEETGPYYDHQVVRLANGTLITGDITFESGHGRVCIEKGSSLQGQVYGGQIIAPHYWQEH